MGVVSWVGGSLREMACAVGTPKWLGLWIQSSVYFFTFADKVAKVAQDSWKGLGVGDNMDERKDCGG